MKNFVNAISPFPSGNRYGKLLLMRLDLVFYTGCILHITKISSYNTLGGRSLQRLSNYVCISLEIVYMQSVVQIFKYCLNEQVLPLSELRLQ